MFQEREESKIKNAKQFNDLASIFIQNHGNINMLFVMIILSHFDVVVFGGVLRDFFAKIPSKDIDLAFEQINYIKDTMKHDLQNKFTELCALYGFEISDFQTVETVNNYQEAMSELVTAPPYYLTRFTELEVLRTENEAHHKKESPSRHKISFVLLVGECHYDIIVDCNRVSNTVESLRANTHPPTVGDSLYLVKDSELKNIIFDSSNTEHKYNIIYRNIARIAKTFINGKDGAVLDPSKIILDLEKKIYAINNLISTKRIIKFFILLQSGVWTMKKDFSDYQPVFLNKQCILDFITFNWPEKLGFEYDENKVFFPSFNEIKESMSDEYVKIKEFILFLETPRVFEKIENTPENKRKILEDLITNQPVIGNWVSPPLPTEKETI